MKNSELLKSNEHRPWDLPQGKWKFYQEWNNVIFLHWKVDFDVLRTIVPSELEIDLFENEAWISLVAFDMEKIRPRNIFAFSPISNFPEINIRTYVRANGKTGVHFLSIEAGKRLSSWIAKQISKLPYRYSKMNRDNNSFNSNNSEYKDSFQIQFKVGEELKEKTALDCWLTERYALFQDHQGAINEFEIHHLEWPTFKIQINQLKVDYPRFNGVLSGSPDLVHYSSGVKVLAWNKVRIS